MTFDDKDEDNGDGGSLEVNLAMNMMNITLMMFVMVIMVTWVLMVMMVMMMTWVFLSIMSR